MKRSVFIFCFFTCSFIFGQNSKIDSLWDVYNSKYQPDTNRLKAINSLAWNFNRNNPDTAIILAEKELQLARTSRQKKYESKALSTIGLSFMNKGNYPKALEYNLNALKIREEIADKNGIAAILINIGSVYRYQSNYSKALEYYFKGLKIWEENGNKYALGMCYGNIGLIYQQQSNYTKALEYDLKSLKTREEIADKNGIGMCYGNIGIVYYYQSNYPKALDYFLKDLKIAEEIGDKKGIGSCYGNIGELYNKLTNYKLAILYNDSALKISKEIGDINMQCSAYQNLAIAHNKTGRYKQAYEYHVKFKTLTDSIFNSENSKQLGDLKTQFEVDKKEAELKIKSEAEQEKLKAISGEEKKRQQVIIYSVAGVLLIVIIFSLFLFNRFRITQRQKKVIEEQKVLVDKAYETLHEKNKEVMDSINYASRIQRALITSDKYIATQLRRLMKNG